MRKMDVTKQQYHAEFAGFDEAKEYLPRIRLIDGHSAPENEVRFVKKSISRVVLTLFVGSAGMVYGTSSFFKDHINAAVEKGWVDEKYAQVEKEYKTVAPNRMPQQKLLDVVVSMLDVQYLSDEQIVNTSLYFVAEANKDLFAERDGSLMSYVREYLQEANKYPKEELLKRVRGYVDIIHTSNRSLTHDETYRLVALLGAIADIEYGTFTRA